MKPIKDYIVDLDTVKDESVDLSYQLTDAFFKLFNEAPISTGSVNADIHIEKCGLGEYLIEFSLKGKVTVACDRCLADMEQEVATTDAIKIRFGLDIQVGDEVISTSDEDDSEFDYTLDDGETSFDLAWPMFELCLLALPLQNIHPDGECDPNMIKLLNEHLAVLPGGKNEATEEKDETDPRWDKLKKILNNN